MKPVNIFQNTAVASAAAPLSDGLPSYVPAKPKKSVIIPFYPMESEEAEIIKTMQPAVRGNAVKKKYEVASVEISYNGNGERFDQFLAAVMREYLSSDSVSPAPSNSSEL